MKKHDTPKLSIIIVTFNSDATIEKCLTSINREIIDIKYEIIVIDNGSKDNTIKQIKTYMTNKSFISPIRLILNNDNLGFGKANNQGIYKAYGDYILLLNPDVILSKISFKKLIEHFYTHTKLGVLTIDLLRPNNTRDMACHRGFPTLWRSFCYFSKLEILFSSSKVLSRIFGGYHLLHNNLNTLHEIESPSAAFYLTTHKILKEINGFDEDYFMYGEDLDLSYRIKQKGYSIYFNPIYKAMHIKYQSGLNSLSLNAQKQTKNYFYDSMSIFYNKHYSSRYPRLINSLVNTVISRIKNIT